MYRFVYLLGWSIRQFLLPNPFSPMGPSGEIVNLGAGVVFIALSYFQVSLIYDAGSNPSAGSLYFTLAYMANTAVAYLIMLFYPTMWIIELLAVVYLIMSFGLLSLVGRRRF